MARRWRSVAEWLAERETDEADQWDRIQARAEGQATAAAIDRLPAPDVAEDREGGQ
jgi:hypothetical protein